MGAEEEMTLAVLIAARLSGQCDTRTLNASYYAMHGREIVLPLNVQHRIVGFGDSLKFKGPARVRVRPDV
jgi:hypothetical protein